MVIDPLPQRPDDDETPGRGEAFWQWYERHEKVNTVITAALFALQLIHLYWLTTHVLALRVLGHSYFSPSPLWQMLLIAVDYTEIPALVSTSVYYVHRLRRAFSWRHLWFLIFLNSQWLHILWITDEFVVERFTGEAPNFLPLSLAWAAILIDYLELPVIVDTLKSAARTLKEEGLKGLR